MTINLVKLRDFVLLSHGELMQEYVFCTVESWGVGGFVLLSRGELRDLYC